MDFERILNQWEMRGHKSSSRSSSNTKAKKEFSDKWLDDYPPDSRAIKAKEEGQTSQPNEENRTILRNQSPQDTIDLHGLTEIEAREALNRFIQSMKHRGLKVGLIIHGKGLHSPEGSVLTPMVQHCMEISSEISRFGYANSKRGGRGATWFIIRQRSR